MAAQGSNYETTYGPYLRFNGYLPSKQLWRISVLVVAGSAQCTAAPTLTLHDTAQPGSSTQVIAVKLDDMQGWGFWRFDLAVECGPAERVVEYAVVMPQGCQHTLLPGPHRVAIPAADKPVRWGFYSCNGFHEPQQEIEAGGIQPLWKDVMACHQQTPFHMMLGGGDQLYNDPVWKCEELAKWTGVDADQERLNTPFSAEMHKQVAEYYVNAYLRHWSQPVFADALATIPQAMVWDDHDIFDGWGSYPDYLQACAVFQGVYAAARRTYGLFQHHTTEARAVADNDVFGKGGWHWVGNVDSTTALILMDSRSERSQKLVLHPESWAMIQQRLQALPASTRHVIVVATVPMIYPKIPMMESTLECLNCTLLCGMARTKYSPMQLLQKTGLADSLISQFGTVEILDDLVDHWGADVHAEERKAFVRMLQSMAEARGFRFTIVSGDVHLAAVGKFASAHRSKSRDPRIDYRYMPQIISSAIGNMPPPDGVVNTLLKFARRNKLDFHTEDMMVDDVFGGKMLLPARNWLAVRPQTMAEGGALNLQFRVEGKPQGGRIDTYDMQVPCLEGITPATQPAPSMDPPHVAVTLPLVANGTATA